MKETLTIIAFVCLSLALWASQLGASANDEFSRHCKPLLVRLLIRNPTQNTSSLNVWSILSWNRFSDSKTITHLEALRVSGFRNGSIRSATFNPSFVFGSARYREDLDEILGHYRDALRVTQGGETAFYGIAAFLQAWETSVLKNGGRLPKNYAAKGNKSGRLLFGRRLLLELAHYYQLHHSIPLGAQPETFTEQAYHDFSLTAGFDEIAAHFGSANNFIKEFLTFARKKNRVKKPPLALARFTLDDLIEHSFSGMDKEAAEKGAIYQPLKQSQVKNGGTITRRFGSFDLFNFMRERRWREMGGLPWIVAPDLNARARLTAEISEGLGLIPFADRRAVNRQDLRRMGISVNRVMSEFGYLARLNLELALRKIIPTPSYTTLEAVGDLAERLKFTMTSALLELMTARNDSHFPLLALVEMDRGDNHRSEAAPSDADGEPQAIFRMQIEINGLFGSLAKLIDRVNAIRSSRGEDILELSEGVATWEDELLLQTATFYAAQRGGRFTGYQTVNPHEDFYWNPTNGFQSGTLSLERLNELVCRRLYPNE